MADCHRCGYQNLETVEWIGYHPYGPDCAEVVRRGEPDAVTVLRADEVRRRRAYCDRCDTCLTAVTTRREHREMLRLHRRTCR